MMHIWVYVNELLWYLIVFISTHWICIDLLAAIAYGCIIYSLLMSMTTWYTFVLKSLLILIMFCSCLWQHCDVFWEVINVIFIGWFTVVAVDCGLPCRIWNYNLINTAVEACLQLCMAHENDLHANVIFKGLIMNEWICVTHHLIFI